MRYIVKDRRSAITLSAPAVGGTIRISVPVNRARTFELTPAQRETFAACLDALLADGTIFHEQS